MVFGPPNAAIKVAKGWSFQPLLAIHSFSAPLIPKAFVNENTVKKYIFVSIEYFLILKKNDYSLLQVIITFLDFLIIENNFINVRNYFIV